MNITSSTIHPFAWLQDRLASLLTPARPFGFCPRCERYTSWDDEHLFYRCSNCGGDPVEHASHG